MARFPDGKISQLIQEQKVFGDNWEKQVQGKHKRGGKEASISLKGEFGSKFQLVVNQNSFNRANFCIVLGFYPVPSKKLFRLLRYDGNDHAHTNKLLKGDSIEFIEYQCHRHISTERYQDAGEKSDSYAEPDNRYSNLEEAFECAIQDCNIVYPYDKTLPLFNWWVEDF